MSVTNQLYQLQEIDLQIESNEQSLRQKTSQLGESHEVIAAREKLASEQQRREDLGKQQHSYEWDIDDLTNKITAIEEKLYGGRINNPKELASLQQEENAFKASRDQLETKSLEVMEQVEMIDASITETGGELKNLESEWKAGQKKLSTEIDGLKTVLSALKDKRQLVSGEIDSPAIKLYEKLQKQKGQAVVKVEQGICRGCRISLPSSDLQQVRSRSLVQCSSCGRLLFLP